MTLQTAVRSDVPTFRHLLGIFCVKKYPKVRSKYQLVVYGIKEIV